LAAGEIVGVGRVAWYSAANPFSRFVGAWYKLRLAFRQTGRTAQEALAKRILTILPGKFGQHSREWRDCPLVHCADLTGHWWSWDAGAGQWQVYRALAGRAQLYTAPAEWKHSFPAISAHVTSAARVATDMAVSIAGAYDCTYYNTDALHVTALGLQRLESAGLLHETTLGRLKLQGTYNGGVYRNALDVTLSSAPDTARIAGGGDHPQDHGKPTDGPRGSGSRVFVNGLDAWRTAVYVQAACRFRYRGRVGQDGWVTPLWLTPGPNGELFGRLVDRENLGQ
jgi:hypothetical protein